MAKLHTKMDISYSGGAHVTTLFVMFDPGGGLNEAVVNVHITAPPELMDYADHADPPNPNVDQDEILVSWLGVPLVSEQWHSFRVHFTCDPGVLGIAALAGLAEVILPPAHAGLRSGSTKAVICIPQVEGT